MDPMNPSLTNRESIQYVTEPPYALGVFRETMQNRLLNLWEYPMQLSTGWCCYSRSAWMLFRMHRESG
jgi:hypothetical protein